MSGDNDGGRMGQLSGLFFCCLSIVVVLGQYIISVAENISDLSPQKCALKTLPGDSHST